LAFGFFGGHRHILYRMCHLPPVCSAIGRQSDHWRSPVACLSADGCAFALHCPPPLDQRRKSIKCHCFRVRRARHKYQSAEKCRIPEQMDKGVKALDRSKSTSSHNRNSPAIVDTHTEYRSHSGAHSITFLMVRKLLCFIDLAKREVT
jgi:hypothetical protein